MWAHIAAGTDLSPIVGGKCVKSISVLIEPKNTFSWCDRVYFRIAFPVDMKHAEAFDGTLPWISKDRKKSLKITYY